MAVQTKNGRKKLIILHLKCCKRQQKTKNSIFFAFFFKKICIYQKKSSTFAPDLIIVQITTFKKITIMKTIYQLVYKTSDNVEHDLIFGNKKRCEKALKRFYSEGTKWRKGTYITNSMIISRTLF